MLREVILNRARIVRRVWFRGLGLLKVAYLRMIGCDVSWSAAIHPSAHIEPSGGQIQIGAGTFVDRGAIIRAMGGCVRIGKNCSVNAYAVLSGAGGVSISDSVMIASHVSIYASNHVFDDIGRSMREQGLTAQGVVIEEDVWVGAGARILDGTLIGHGAVIAAGAVVTKSVPSYAVTAGVPARQIGDRRTRNLGTE